MKNKITQISIVFTLIFLSFTISAQIVRMETVLGDIDIELRADVAPLTVTNFLNYINDGDYNDSVIHRSVSNFIIQGGAFTFRNGVTELIPTNGTVVNEYNLSNLRGTIAMAKVAGDPDSATSQWFFNTEDNSSNLDNQNGGFTVFGKVIAGMDVVDAIAALQISFINQTFSSIPLINYTSGNEVLEENLVLIRNASVINATMKLNSGLNGAWFNPSTPGQGIMVEYLPKQDENSEDKAFLAWFTHDSQDPNASETTQIGAVGQRWLSSIASGANEVDQDENTITFNIAVTSGGLFDSSQTVTQTTDHGTLVVVFEDCSNATATYNLTDSGLSGSFPLIRISASNIALCERLSIESQ